MVKRKKPKAAGDQLSEFVVDVASGDMPTETVIRADKGKNPVADALRRMGQSEARRLAPRGQRSGTAKNKHRKGEGAGPGRGPRGAASLPDYPPTGYSPAACVTCPRSTRDAPCQPRLSAG
jgi:hypothetical protein